VQIIGKSTKAQLKTVTANACFNKNQAKSCTQKVERALSAIEIKPDHRNKPPQFKKLPLIYKKSYRDWLLSRINRYYQRPLIHYDFT